MKIGIITQPLHNNYGGLLQNYALQQVLISMGHEPITLDWKPFSTPKWKRFIYYCKIYFKKYVLSDKTIFLPRYRLSEKENEIISRNNRRFIDKYILSSKKVLSSSGFKELTISNQLDVLIVGSDQCWRPIYACGHIRNMFLQFAEELDVKRVSYAASFGTDLWEFSEADTMECKRLAHKFDLITIREESGIELCKKYLEVSAIHVLDPTMLHDKIVYEQITKNMKTPKSNGDLFYYILDPSEKKSQFINNIAKSSGLRPFTVMPTYQTENRTRYNVKNEISKCVFPGVEQWLRAFMDAELVVCDSFHGCVFSIIFNKPFWVVSNLQRGNARFISLLKMFELEDRLVPVDGNLDILQPIDWGKVNNILEQKRTYSKLMLMNVLK